MADTPLQPQLSYSQTRLSQACQWNAIWGGVFVFAAIWSVFETLGVAIFASSTNATRGIDAGMAIWTIILTIIAMYVAGRQTSRMAAPTTRNDGLIHGMIMFGLSVVGVLVLSAIGSAATATSVHPLFSLRFVMGSGWASFIALLLGWLAAMGGASTLDRATITAAKQPVPMRPAA